MRKKLSAVLLVLLLLCLAPGALAQTVPCPRAHLSLTVPEDWVLVPLDGTEDPGLCLLLENGDMNLSVYIDSADGLLQDSFQVLTGDDRESTEVSYAGVRMTCVSGESEEGAYRIYTWLDESSQVQFYFLITGTPRSARGLIEDIMGSIVFDP